MIKIAQNVIKNDLLWRKRKVAIKFIAFRPGEGYFKDIFPLNSAEIVTKKCKDGWLLKRLNPQMGSGGARSWNDIKERCMPIT